MALLTLDQVSLVIGEQILLDKVSLSIQAHEKIALLGRNGAGKTTFFNIISGHQSVDEGEIHARDGLKISQLPQEVPKKLSGSVFDVVAGGAGKAREQICHYHAILKQLQTDADNPALLQQLQHAQETLENSHGWHLAHQVSQIISRMGLDGDTQTETLSGGLKRRVLLARALVNQPDILLLDEPTNHLDIEAILWLETFIRNYQACVLFVSHDRIFTQQVASRILELDRGKLFSWKGDYHNYLRRKEEQLHAEYLRQQQFDKKLAQEEQWIRQGIKARRTRNEGRVRALKQMREQLQKRRQQLGQVTLSIDDQLRSGKIVAEVEHLGWQWKKKGEEQWLFKDFSCLLLRGERVGIIGPNGVGKTTLLRLILGDLTPQKGKVHLGSKLNIAWFDQLRSQLDPQKTVLENIGEGRDYVTIAGKQRHVYSYLRDFLFTAERARTQVGALSGGERNRLLLARLFTRPSNLLVMDEPTNDLDSDTLDLLQDLLQDYQGTLLLVSHDRAFLNQVVTSTWVFEKNSDSQCYHINQYAGGYDDYISQSQHKQNAKKSDTASLDAKAVIEKKSLRNKNKSTSKKISYKEKQELAQLPERIEQLEVYIAQLQEASCTKAFYQQDQQQIKMTLMQLQQAEQQLEEAYQRWELLEQK